MRVEKRPTVMAEGGHTVVVVLLVALLIALAFGAGFALEVLWYVALALLAVWVIGFFARGAERTWYRW